MPAPEQIPSLSSLLWEEFLHGPLLEIPSLDNLASNSSSATSNIANELPEPALFPPLPSPRSINSELLPIEDDVSPKETTKIKAKAKKPRQPKKIRPPETPRILTEIDLPILIEMPEFDVKFNVITYKSNGQTLVCPHDLFPPLHPNYHSLTQPQKTQFINGRIKDLEKMGIPQSETPMCIQGRAIRPLLAKGWYTSPKFKAMRFLVLDNLPYIKLELRTSIYPLILKLSAHVNPNISHTSSSQVSPLTPLTPSPMNAVLPEGAIPEPSSLDKELAAEMEQAISSLSVPKKPRQPRKKNKHGVSIILTEIDSPLTIQSPDSDEFKVMRYKFNGQTLICLHELILRSGIDAHLRHKADFLSTRVNNIENVGLASEIRYCRVGKDLIPQLEAGKWYFQPSKMIRFLVLDNLSNLSLNSKLLGYPLIAKLKEALSPKTNEIGISPHRPKRKGLSKTPERQKMPRVELLTQFSAPASLRQPDMNAALPDGVIPTSSSFKETTEIVQAILPSTSQVLEGIPISPSSRAQCTPIEKPIVPESAPRDKSKNTKSKPIYLGEITTKPVKFDIPNGTPPFSLFLYHIGQNNIVTMPDLLRFYRPESASWSVGKKGYSALSLKTSFKSESVGIPQSAFVTVKQSSFVRKTAEAMGIHHCHQQFNCLVLDELLKVTWESGSQSEYLPSLKAIQSAYGKYKEKQLEMEHQEAIERQHIEETANVLLAFSKAPTLTPTASSTPSNETNTSLVDSSKKRRITTTETIQKPKITKTHIVVPTPVVARQDDSAPDAAPLPPQPLATQKESNPLSHARNTHTLFHAPTRTTRKPSRCGTPLTISQPSAGETRTLEQNPFLL